MSAIRPTTYDAILEAAFQVFGETPTAALSDVARRAGVGRATLHRHFPGRAELMRALALRALEDLQHAVATATADATSYEGGFRLALEAVVPLADRQWFLSHEDLEGDADVAAAYAKDQLELLADIDAAKADGVFAADMPTPWIAEAFENLTYAAWSLVRSGDATPKQAADLAWRTFFSGVRGDTK